MYVYVQEPPSQLPHLASVPDILEGGFEAQGLRKDLFEPELHGTETLVRTL